MPQRSSRDIPTDEITYPINSDRIDITDVSATIMTRAEYVPIVLTGRDAPLQIIDVADAVLLEIGDVKRALRFDIRAKKHIEF